MSLLGQESSSMENLNLLLNRLLESQIDFVLIGGYASVLHGSSHVTHDLDICAVMTETQLEKLKKALHDLNPKHRMNPNFQLSLDEYPKAGQLLDNFYLSTSSGVLDIIKTVTSVGDFEVVKKNAIKVQLFGKECLVISLDDLIKAKSKMNRDKDKFVLQELLKVKEKLTQKK
jgi:hypothetical protein